VRYSLNRAIEGSHRGRRRRRDPRPTADPTAACVGTGLACAPDDEVNQALAMVTSGWLLRLAAMPTLYDVIREKILFLS
jgi:hypothetical protein